MLFNEAKLPLEVVPHFETPEEVLAHFGVVGMHWGRRRGRSSQQNFPEEENHSNTKRNVAVGILIGVGAVATVAVLKNSGGIKLSGGGLNQLTKNAGEERSAANKTFRSAGRKLKVSTPPYKEAGDILTEKLRNPGRTFTPKDVRNPLITRVRPKKLSTKQLSALVSNDEARGTAALLELLGPNIFSTPVRSLTSSR